MVQKYALMPSKANNKHISKKKRYPIMAVNIIQKESLLFASVLEKTEAE